MVDIFFRLFFLLFLFSFNFSFSQLTTFTENSLDRFFILPTNTTPVSFVDSPSDVLITVDTNNIFNRILPTHFGLNFPHFIGDNVLDEEESIIEKSDEYSIDTVKEDNTLNSSRVTEQKSEMFDEDEGNNSLSSVGSLFSRVSSIFGSTKLFSTSETKTKSRDHIFEEDDIR